MKTDKIHFDVVERNGMVDLELRGNTFPRKDEIKALGFKWVQFDGFGIWQKTVTKADHIEAVEKIGQQFGITASTFFYTVSR